MSGRPYAEVIGDPVAHSKSPLIHNFWLAKLGIDAEYRTCHVRPGELADYFTRRRGDTAWRGCNVTIPHKVAAVSHVLHVDVAAERVGAINTVRRSGWEIIGFNTDINGVYQAFYEGAGSRLPNAESICLIGTGGAARAAMYELADIKVRSVSVIARSKASAEALLSDFQQPGQVWAIDDAAAALDGANGLVNASSLGMSGKPDMPNSVLIGVQNLRPDAFVFDMVYAPLETTLLNEARAQNRKSVDGLVMLICQAAKAFEEFFGQYPPRQYDAELRTLLTA